MNIYLTSLDLEECAQALNDRLLNKAINDAAQILTNWQPDASSYHVSKQNDPASKWATMAPENASLIVEYNAYLCDEYQQRFNKEHPTWDGVGQLLFEEIDFVHLDDKPILYPGARNRLRH